MTISLYHNDVAVCAQKVRLVLAEKGLTYTSHLLDLRAGESHTPEYLKLNPKGVVPTLIDEGKVINESSIINEYLEQAYPENNGSRASLACKTAYDNSQMRAWINRTDTGLLQHCGVVSFAIAFRHQEQSAQLTSLTPEKRKKMEEVNKQGINYSGFINAISAYYQLINDMAERLKDNVWLAGDNFSLAECALAPYIKRLDDLALSWIWELDPSKAGFTCWYKRCSDRSSFKAAITDLTPANKQVLMRTNGLKVKTQVADILGIKIPY